MKKPKPKISETARSDYQPSKAELEADMSIPCEPDELLEAVFNHQPRRHGKPLNPKGK